MSRNLLILFIVLAVLAAAWAITLQATSQPAAASEFVGWAGGGLVTMIAIVWLFGGERDW